MQYNYKKSIFKKLLTSASIVGLLSGTGMDTALAGPAITRIVNNSGSLSFGDCFKDPNDPFISGQQIRYDDNVGKITISADIDNTKIKAINLSDNNNKRHVFKIENNLTIGSISTTGASLDGQIALEYMGNYKITFDGNIFDDAGENFGPNKYDKLHKIDINNHPGTVEINSPYGPVYFTNTRLANATAASLDVLSDFFAINENFSTFEKININAKLHFEQEQGTTISTNGGSVNFNSENASLTLKLTNTDVTASIAPNVSILPFDDNKNTIELIGQNNTDMTLDLGLNSLGVANKRFAQLTLKDALKISVRDASAIHVRKIDIATQNVGNNKNKFDAPIFTGENGELFFTTDNQSVLFQQNASISQINFNNNNNSKVIIGNASSLTLGDNTIPSYKISDKIVFESETAELLLTSGANLGKTNPVTIKVESDLTPVSDRKNAILLQNNRTDGGELVIESDGDGLRHLGTPGDRFATFMIKSSNNAPVRIKNIIGDASNQIDVGNFVALQIEDNTDLISETNTIIDIKDINIAPGASLSVDVANGEFTLLPTVSFMMRFNGTDSTLNISNSEFSKFKDITIENSLDPGFDGKGIINFTIHPEVPLFLGGGGSLGTTSGGALKEVNISDGFLELDHVGISANTVNIKNNGGIAVDRSKVFNFNDLNIGVISGNTRPNAVFVIEDTSLDLMKDNNISLNEPNATLTLQNANNTNDTTVRLHKTLTPTDDSIGILSILSSFNDKEFILDFANPGDSIGISDSKRINRLDINGTGNTRITGNVFVKNIIISSLDINIVFEQNLTSFNKTKDIGQIVFIGNDNIVKLHGDNLLGALNFVSSDGNIVEVADNKLLHAGLQSLDGKKGVVRFLGSGTLDNTVPIFGNGISKLEIGSKEVKIKGTHNIHEVFSVGGGNIIFEDNSTLIGGINNNGAGAASSLFFLGNANISDNVGSLGPSTIGSVTITGGAGTVVDFEKNIYGSLLQFQNGTDGTVKFGGDAHFDMTQMLTNYNIEIYNDQDHSIKLGRFDAEGFPGGVGSIKVTGVSDKHTVTIAGSIGDVDKNDARLKTLNIDGKTSVIFEEGDVHIGSLQFGDAGVLSLAGTGNKYKFNNFIITKDKNPILNINDNVSILAPTSGNLNIGDINDPSLQLAKLSFSGDVSLTIEGGVNIHAKELDLGGNTDVEINYDLSNNRESTLDAKIVDGDKLKSFNVFGNATLTVSEKLSAQEINISTTTAFNSEVNTDTLKVEGVTSAVFNHDITAKELQLIDTESGFFFNHDNLILDSPITASASGKGVAAFAKNTTINQPIGASKAELQIIAFADKIFNINNNLFAKDILFIKSQITIQKDAIFDGNIQANNATFNLGSHTLSLQNGNTKLQGNITINTDINGGNIGHILRDVTVTNFDASAASNINVNVTVSAAPTENSVILINTNDTDNIDENLLQLGSPLPPELDSAELVIDENGAIVLNFTATAPPTPAPAPTPVPTPTPEQDQTGVAEAPSSFATGGNAGAALDDTAAFITAATSASDPLQTLDVTGINNAANNNASVVGREIADTFRNFTGQISAHLPHVNANETLTDALELTSDTLSTTGISAGASDPRYGIWVKPYIGTSTQKKRGNISGYDSDIYGGTVGFDVKCHDRITLGIAASFSESEISHKANNSGDKTDLTTWMGSVYGLYSFTSKWFVHGALSYSTSEIKTKHQRVLDSKFVLAQGKHRSHMIGGELLTGYHYLVSSSLVATPTIGLGYAHSDNKGFKETGAGSQNANISSDSTDKIDGILGIRFTVPEFQIKNSLQVVPQAHAFVRHDFKGDKHAVNVNFAENIGGDSATKTVNTNRTIGNFGVGVDLKYKMLEFGLAYDLTVANKYTGHQGNLKVRVNF